MEERIEKVVGSNGVRPSAAIYGLTLAAVTGAGLLRWLFDPFLGDQLPFITFFVGVAAAAWLGGLRPALLATGLGFVVAWYFFVPPRYSFALPSGPHLLELAMYFMVCLAFAGFGEARHAARRRAVRDRVKVLAERERFRLAAEAVNGIIYEFSFETGHVERTRGLYALVGYRADEVPPTAAWWHEQVHPDDRELARRRFEEAAASGNIVVTEYRLRHKDGRWLHVEDRAVILKDGGGKPVRMIGCTVDVTERKRIEAERESTQKTLAAVVERCPFGIYIVDDEFRMMHVNTPSENVAFVNVRPLIGRLFDEVVRIVWPEPVAADVINIFRHTFATGESYSSREFVTRRADTGQTEGYEWETHRITLPSGRHGVVCYYFDATRLRQAEAKLRESESRFTVALKNSRILVSTTDADLRYTWMHNPHPAFNSVDVLGRRDDELLPPGQAAPLTAIKRDVLNSGVGRRAEFAAEINGERAVYDLTVEPLRDGTGSVVGVTVAATDITARKREETALRISEVRYRRLFESAKDGILILDAHAATITDANPFMAEMLGYSRDEFVGKELWQIGLFTDVGASKAAMRKLQEKGYIRYEDLPLETKAGRRINVEFVSNVYGEVGEAVIQCNVRDITDRKRMQDTLKESERRFRTLVEQVKDYAIFMTDPEGRATSWNEGVERVLGFAEAEWIGRDIVPLIFTPEDVRDGVGRREFEEARASGTAGDDRWMIRKDGIRFFALGILTALRDEAGGLLGFTKIMRDQTDRKRLEDQLRHLAADLSEADRRKDVFLATLAHELRNPLAPIRNGLQVIRLAGATGTVEQARSMMDRQLTQLVRLVDDLLDVSRVTSGKLELRKERVGMKAVIDAAVETSRPAIEQAGHDFAVVVPDEPIFVDGDHTRLTQVVSNLLNNSAKYTHRGGHIRLSVGREDGRAVVSVTDDGIGIPTTMLEKVFGMFAQVDRTLEKTTGGLGIGLSLVKGLVEMHGGTIEARSEGEGKGSEFVVRLPVVSASVGGADQPNGQAEEVVPSGRRRVLVVDDNVDAADSLAQLLELLGNEVRTANDGEAGVAAAGEFRPDVVLMDIGMPVLNGYEACRRIREQPWGRNMVLVALTGWGQDDDRRKTAEAGFDSHMVKPVEFAALTKLLAGLEAVKH